MAVINKGLRTVPRTVIVDALEPYVTGVTLNAEETQFLFDILGRVGGSPCGTRRAIADDIIKCLRAAGLERDSSDIDGNLMFGRR